MKKTKKILSIFLALLMIASIIPMTSITASATSRTPDDAMGWCQSELGHSLDYDGWYGAQCVDLIAYYYQWLGVTTPGGNGCDYATNALPSGWTRVQGGTPQKGDILVYSGNSANPYGHVAIYESDYSHYHQNFNGHSYVEKITTIRYNGFSNPYWGYIRPNWGSGSSPSTSYFTSVWVDNITKTDATIHATITGTNLSTCGFYIGKSQSAMEKRTETVNGYVEGIWYVMSTDYKPLEPGTTYYYKFFITVGGVEYGSEVKSFKTAADTYTISYNANGGSGAPASQTKTQGTALTLSSTKPTRTGYTFLGWSTSRTATTATYSASGSFTIDAYTTLYAVWKANTYSVKYNANGGSGTMANSSHTYNTSKALTTNSFTRDGYTFLGWSTSSTATTPTYTNGQTVVNLTATDGGVVNLYAVWEKNAVTVSSISIATKPIKTEYYVGETFNSSGLSIKVTMSDGTTQTLTSGFTVSSPNMSTAGVKTVTVTYSGKTAIFTINVVEKQVTPDTPDADYSINIRTPSRTTIRYKDGIILHANIEGELPAGTQVVWYVSNDNFDGGYLDDGMSCVFVSENDGYTTIYAVLEDANGNELAIDSIELRSKAGFFDKIGGFFRNLFGSTTIYEY